MSCPCHIELILAEAEENVAKADTSAVSAHLSSRQRGQRIHRALIEA